MTEVAKVMAGIKLEVETIKVAEGDLQGDDPVKQETALTEIAVSGMSAAAKADEIIDRLKDIRSKLSLYQRQDERLTP